MKSKILFLMIGIVFILGCTAQEPANLEGRQLSIESRCKANEDLCIIGTPGLLNSQSIYSGSDTFFSIILRNNLQGQVANNVEVQLKNIGPFKIVEGYSSGELTTEGVCILKQGEWGPAVIRTIQNSPNPQFVDDLGLPFAKHKLRTMYPDEEVEFMWRLRAPSFQEIADVAYSHKFDYVVSYDYSAGILQTVYAISEEEYQRVLRTTGSEPRTSGTITGSVGALSISSSVQEPVRVQSRGGQFSLIYQIWNSRTGVPIKPAIFLLQFPEGLEFAGNFQGPQSLEEFGYIDLNSAVKYYNTSADVGFQGGVCMPREYDENSDILAKESEGLTLLGAPATCSANFVSTPLSDVFAYIRETFPDITFNEEKPNIVIKFLYPVDLVSERSFIYYPMLVNEDITISKFYTFRLKTKYRYSFSGSDSIIIVPNDADFEADRQNTVGFLWGDITPNFNYLADNYALREPDSLTLEMSTSEGHKLTSFALPLRSYNFLHVIGFESTRPDKSLECTSDTDCGLYYCNTGDDNTCYFDSAFNEQIRMPHIYNFEVGYNTGISRINKMLSTGSSFYSLGDKKIYFVNEYPYVLSLPATFNRADPNNHRPVSDFGQSISFRDLSNSVKDFIEYKAFFEVKEDSGIVLSDNDRLGYVVDYASYDPTKTNIPVNLQIINYYDNETFFMINDNIGLEGGGNNFMLMGLYTSQYNLASSTLLMYLFNRGGENMFLEYNVSLLNYSTTVVGQTVVSKEHFKQVYTNLYAESYNAADYPYTKNVAPNNYLFKTFKMDYGRNYAFCDVNAENMKPILFIEYTINTRDPPLYDTISGANSGIILIGDYDSVNEVISATIQDSPLHSKIFNNRDIITLIKGRVNVCRS